MKLLVEASVGGTRRDGLSKQHTSTYSNSLTASILVYLVGNLYFMSCIVTSKSIDLLLHRISSQCLNKQLANSLTV